VPTTACRGGSSLRNQPAACIQRRKLQTLHYIAKHWRSFEKRTRHCSAGRIPDRYRHGGDFRIRV